MNPIIDYEIAKTQHREITAEFDRYWRYHQDEPNQPHASSRYRLIFGWGSLILGIFIVAQTFIG